MHGGPLQVRFLSASSCELDFGCMHPGESLRLGEDSVEW